MKMGNSFVINKRKENNIANTTFDCGGTPTFTTVSNYAELKTLKSIDEDVSTAELIKKLDSLRDEPAIEYSNASSARLHIKKLMRE